MNTDTQTNKQNKWIWIGLGAAILFCCCAVAIALFTFYKIGEQVGGGIQTDPESAAESAHAIMDYDLPEGYQERMAMNFGFYSIAMIGPEVYSDERPLIMFAQFNQYGLNEEQMEQQVRQSFEQQSGRRGLTMEIKDVKKMTIRGEDTDVVIYEGTDDNGLAMRQLITTFPGKDGTAMLMIMGSPMHWDDDEIDQFIESIH